jgi:uncharacterized protein (TIGR03435 family)
MFAQRMKLLAHVEERERNMYALVKTRHDGRLGPQLRTSVLDCATASRRQEQRPPALDDAEHRCGMQVGPGTIGSGGLTMDQLVVPLGGLAGRVVNNRTGLEGWYALTLRYAATGGVKSGAETSPPNDAPEIFTALQEQLGLKLQPEKASVPVLVIDHIERPTPN